jgi:hypothetical protein
MEEMVLPVVLNRDFAKDQKLSARIKFDFSAAQHPLVFVFNKEHKKKGSLNYR